MLEQRDAILNGRQLLHDPDPVRPLLDAITEPLREHVRAAAARLREHHAQAIGKLEATDEWQQLDDTAWTEIVNEVGLQRPSDIDVSTQEKLLAVLNDAPLSSWQDKIEVVHARAKRAHEEAARRLEPTAVRVSFDAATLKTKEDAEACLDDVRNPTVTATTKPVLTPIPEASLVAGPDLGPARARSGAKASIAMLRGFMAERGVQVLQGAETGDPTGCAWTEAADIDKRGHDFGLAFVDEIDRELDDIAKRVKLLLDAGWEQVDVVTDHGWLLLPTGLEKVDLPVATVEVRKGRCARLKEGAAVDVPTVPWHWDQDVRIALAPGISCFEANKEYEHGGVSLQECVVPRLRVRAGAIRRTTGGAAISKVKWLGLMCRVEFANVAPGAIVDIRALPADASTSVAQTVKETTSGGRQSLHVSDEDLEGEKAYIVIVGADGAILAQREATIGVNR